MKGPKRKTNKGLAARPPYAGVCLRARLKVLLKFQLNISFSAAPTRFWALQYLCALIIVFIIIIIMIARQRDPPGG